MTVVLDQRPAVAAPPPLVAGLESPVAKPSNATLVERVEVTDSMARFRVRLDSPPQTFRPGQYVSLGLWRDGALLQRAYSIAHLDLERSEAELFIRRVDGGTLTPVLWRLQAGERVRVGPPKGLFILDETDRRARIFVGTGTGLAPLLAMLERLALTGDRSPNVLIQGAAYQAELAYRERIEGWVRDGLDLWHIPSVSRPDDPANAGWTGTRGRADAVLARVFAADPSLCGGVAYLCGNAGMLEVTTAALIAAGMRATDVRAERFSAQAPGIAATM